MELPREIAQIVLTNAALVSGKEAKLPALPGQTIASEAAPEIVTDKDKAASKRKKIKQQIAHT